MLPRPIMISWVTPERNNRPGLHGSLSVQDIGFTSWFSREIELQQALESISSAESTSAEIAAMPQYMSRARSIAASMEKLGLKPTAVSLGVPFFLNPGLNLHSAEKSVRDESLHYVQESIEFAASIGAEIIYVCSLNRGPPGDHHLALRRLAEAIKKSADSALAKGLRLAIEPFPKGELPTVRDTIRFISTIRSENVGLVIDTGHAAISGEDLVETARISNGLISHVHLNNNDGASDLHWAPQKGKLTKADFRKFLLELRRQRYGGEISIELSRPVPLLETLIQSRGFVRDLLDDESRDAIGPG
jgi:sugar phosphate isomerase/epimerase